MYVCTQWPRSHLAHPLCTPLPRHPLHHHHQDQVRHRTMDLPAQKPYSFCSHTAPPTAGYQAPAPPPPPLGPPGGYQAPAPPTPPMGYQAPAPPPPPLMGYQPMAAPPPAPPVGPPAPPPPPVAASKCYHNIIIHGYTVAAFYASRRSRTRDTVKLTVCVCVCVCVCLSVCVCVCSSCNCSTVAMRRKLTASIGF